MISDEELAKVTNLNKKANFSWNIFISIVWVHSSRSFHLETPILEWTETTNLPHNANKFSFCFSLIKLFQRWNVCVAWEIIKLRKLRSMRNVCIYIKSATWTSISVYKRMAQYVGEWGFFRDRRWNKPQELFISENLWFPFP